MFYRLLASLGIPIAKIETDDAHETVHRLVPEHGRVTMDHLMLRLMPDGTVVDDQWPALPLPVGSCGAALVVNPLLDLANAERNCVGRCDSGVGGLT